MLTLSGYDCSLILDFYSIKVVKTVIDVIEIENMTRYVFPSKKRISLQNTQHKAYFKIPKNTSKKPNCLEKISIRHDILDYGNDNKTIT